MTSFVKKTILSASFLFFALSVFIVPILSLAQAEIPDPVIDPGSSPTSGGASEGYIQNPIKAESINGFIKQLLEGVIKIGIPLVALAIIYSGFLYVTAQGNPGAIEKAHKAFLYTVIGAAILLGSWTLAQIITETVHKL